MSFVADRWSKPSRKALLGLLGVVLFALVDTSHVPQPVRSDTGESLKITAYWKTENPPCREGACLADIRKGWPWCCCLRC